MSESLRGEIPELEDEQFLSIQDSFILAYLDLSDPDGSRRVSGNVLGVSLESTIKVDIRLPLEEAYDFLKKYTASAPVCDSFHLLFDGEVRFDGPFSVTAPRLTDIDYRSKLCTLGLDLARS